MTNYGMGDIKNVTKSTDNPVIENVKFVTWLIKLIQRCTFEKFKDNRNKSKLGFLSVRNKSFAIFFAQITMAKKQSSKEKENVIKTAT